MNPRPHFISIAVSLSPDLEEWIWQDNRNFIQDNNIFDHNYFNFMWRVSSSLPHFLSINYNFLFP